MIDPDAAGRIREAFEHDLAGYQAPADVADLVERARAGGLRQARRRRTHRAASVAAAGCVALVTGLVIVPLTGTAPSGSSAARLPSAASVSRAILTAFSAASGDIVYQTQTGIRNGTVVDEYQTWDWPARPVPGQQALTRDAYAEQTSSSVKALKPGVDYGARYTTGPDGATSGTYRMTMVCYTGTAYIDTHGCGWGNAEIRAGTWSTFRSRDLVMFNDVGRGGDFSPATLAGEIARGQWRVTRHTRVDGQQAIELTETPGRNRYLPLPVLLWVNARTHLPLRMIWGPDSSLAKLDWQYLKPTPANLALLRVPIPRGYPRSSPAVG